MERHEEDTQRDLHPTILVGTRMVMTATREISTPILILGTAQPLSGVQRAANTPHGIARADECGPNDPNYAVDYDGDSDAGKEEATPPRASEEHLRMRTVAPRTIPAKILK